MEDNIFNVCISCITYNQALYIEKTLNGFCMQETTFPFVCTIIDDASIDGEQEVIKNYLSKHFDLEDKSIVRNEETDDYILTFARHKTNHNCFFAVCYLKYNHYSIPNVKMSYVAEWRESCKYIALCEGDDYWTDPEKLQIQIDFLEKHPDYSMCWHDADMLSAKDGSLKGNYTRYSQNTDSPIEDMILGGGDFCPTPSLCFRNDIRKMAPRELFLQYVGDYPLQLLMTFTGKVYFFTKKMCVHQVEVENSWTTRSFQLKDFEQRKVIWEKEFKIYDDFNRYSNYKYSHLFEQKKLLFMFNDYWRFRKYNEARKVWYKIDLDKRTWNLRQILYLHGYNSLRKRIKNYKKPFK